MRVSYVEGGANTVVPSHTEPVQLSGLYAVLSGNSEEALQSVAPGHAADVGGQAAGIERGTAPMRAHGLLGTGSVSALGPAGSLLLPWRAHGMVRRCEPFAWQLKTFAVRRCAVKSGQPLATAPHGPFYRAMASVGSRLSSQSLGLLASLPKVGARMR